MLQDNRIKQALQRGDAVIGTMASEIRSPGFMWMLAHAGFDFVFIDMEHGTYDLPTVADLIKVARLAGITPLVRVPDLGYHFAAQALDAGAMGLMLPRVETREQAEQFVSFMKYPPLGVRGISAHRGHTNYERATPRELVNHMNEHTLVVLQIERQRAVENIDNLLTVPGVDVALIGPLDLTVSLGKEDTNAPAVTAAIQHVLEATQRHNVAMGMHSSTPSVVVEWQRRGATMLTCGTDVGFFSAGAQQTVNALRVGNQADQTHIDTTIDI